jgi:hypothetical protein
MADLFSFPNPVNDVSARLTAAGVVLMGLAAIMFRQPWLLVVLPLGFLARVLTGPKLSLLALFVTRVLTPRLPFEAHYVPGPPKRFAQGIGATVTILAAILYFGFSVATTAYALIGLLVVFAVLESGFGFCAGCQLFALLMRLHVIPESACPECSNIWLRHPSSA